MADFQKSLQQRDSELETQRAKVSTPSHESLTGVSQSVNTASANSSDVTVTPSSILRHGVLNCRLVW